MTKIRLARFSIRFLFAVMAVCALGLGIWKAYIDEPPTHRFPLYEKAPSTRRLRMRIGPNPIAIESVARNDRDGTVFIQSGKGRLVNKTVPNQQVLADCASWLDVVQIDESTTVLLDVRGVAGVPLQLRFREGPTGEYSGDSRRLGRMSANSATQRAEAREYLLPISRLGAIEVSLLPTQ